MAARRERGVLRYLQRLVQLRDESAGSDGQLLECFLKQREEAAFEALVRRHGPMVLGVCRRILRNEEDAQDAFQATFLVLVLKAATVTPREALASWLYGVAYRTALGVRTADARRRAKERAMPKREPHEEEVGEDLRPLLDRELNRLPDKYRLPIVLCDLEGESRKSAAQRLGWREGTLSGRLARGRALLAKRLSRHGLALTVGSVAAALSQGATSAAVPDALALETIRTAMLLSVGRKLIPGLISARIAVLTKGVLKAMLMSKLKIVAVVVLAVAAAGGTAEWYAYTALAQNAPPPSLPAAPREAAKSPALAAHERAQRWKPFQDVQWLLTGVDKDKHTIGVEDRSAVGFTTPAPSPTLVMMRSGAAPFGLSLRDVKVAADARITLNGKKAELMDLAAGMHVTLRLEEKRATVTRIEAASPEPLAFLYVLKEVNAAKRTLTVGVEGKRLTLEGLTVAADVKITLIEQAVPGIAAIEQREVTLKELQAGMPVSLELTPDKTGNLVVVRIIAGVINLRK